MVGVLMVLLGSTILVHRGLAAARYARNVMEAPIVLAPSKERTKSSGRPKREDLQAMLEAPDAFEAESVPLV